MATGAHDGDDTPPGETTCPRAAFPLSSLGPEVRQLLWVPPTSTADPPPPDSHSRGGERGRHAATDDDDDDDEGWSFTRKGLIDWTRAPSPPPPPRTGATTFKAESDGCFFDDDANVAEAVVIHWEAATALKGLARASLRRVRSGAVTVLPRDGASHADLLTRLLQDMRHASESGIGGGGGGGGDSASASASHGGALHVGIQLTHEP
jgi:hypothetical protein